MTGRRAVSKTKYGTFGPYASYQCYRGRFDVAHPRPYSVTEAAILPCVKAEVGRLRVPDSVVETVGDDMARHGWMARRGRIIDNYEDGLIDKTERDRRLGQVADAIAALDTAERMVNVPALDWTWEPRAISTVLQAIWERVELGPDLIPARFCPAAPTRVLGVKIPKLALRIHGDRAYCGRCGYPLGTVAHSGDPATAVALARARGSTWDVVDGDLILRRHRRPSPFSSGFTMGQTVLTGAVLRCPNGKCSARQVVPPPSR